MSKKIRAAITGVGGYVPDYILTNKELETMVETNDEWIVSRTGVKERRILKGENQGVSVMGIAAVQDMLKKTGIDPKEIDCLIFATITPDMTFPATSNIVATAVGATNAFSYDLGAARPPVPDSFTDSPRARALLNPGSTRRWSSSVATRCRLYSTTPTVPRASFSVTAPDVCCSNLPKRKSA